MDLARRGKLLNCSDHDVGGRSDGAAYSQEEAGGGGLLRVLPWDFLFSFLWIWTFPFINLSPGMGWLSMAIKYLIARLAFAFIMATAGAARRNPLSTFSASLSGGSRVITACLFGRIPAQVLGSVVGVWMVMRIFPGCDRGLSPNFSVMSGVAIQALVGFITEIVNLLLAETKQGLVAETVISGISVVAVCEVTGGCTNPGTAFGWAYAKGLHKSIGHLLVYWISPFAGTLLGVHVYNSIVHPDRQIGNLGRDIIRWKSD